MISAGGNGKRGRRAGIPSHRQQTASCPVRGDIKARQISIRTDVAIAGNVGVNQAGIPRRNVLISDLKALPNWIWEIDNEYVRPLDEPFHNLSSVRRLQVEGHPAFIAIRQMPAVVLLRAGVRGDFVCHAVRVTDPWRFNFDHIRPEVRKHGRRTRTRKKTGHVHNFQA